MQRHLLLLLLLRLLVRRVLVAVQAHAHEAYQGSPTPCTLGRMEAQQQA
jgi:hypothetical protein